MERFLGVERFIKSAAHAHKHHVKATILRPPANFNCSNAHALRIVCASVKTRDRMPETPKKAKNLLLDARLTALADLHVSKNRKLHSLSNYVEQLLVRDLRKKGIRLPSEFATT